MEGAELQLLEIAEREVAGSEEGEMGVSRNRFRRVLLNVYMREIGHTTDSARPRSVETEVCDPSVCTCLYVRSLRC